MLLLRRGREIRSSQFPSPRSCHQKMSRMKIPSSLLSDVRKEEQRGKFHYREHNIKKRPFIPSGNQQTCFVQTARQSWFLSARYTKSSAPGLSLLVYVILSSSIHGFLCNTFGKTTWMSRGGDAYRRGWYGKDGKSDECTRGYVGSCLQNGPLY